MKNTKSRGRAVNVKLAYSQSNAVNDKGEIQDVFPSKTKPRHDQAGKKRGELVDMPLIPMEVYKKIQRDKPSMLADLKYYEELFNDTGELQRMEEEEYNEVVAQYRGTLLRAKGVGENMIKTGLQIDYGKLKFVGWIRKKDQRIALIETQGRKGHTAKVGTLMGPNLGVVEAVREDTIIIVERYRNYLGEVLANKQSIKFSTPPQQG
ncbi:MAG: pilus assembly protein PilP [Nitrospinae bacterium]|nr:pilus assembly protein PilP [Nitrospinota bacterium]